MSQRCSTLATRGGAKSYDLFTPTIHKQFNSRAIKQKCKSMGIDPRHWLRFKSTFPANRRNRVHELEFLSLPGILWRMLRGRKTLRLKPLQGLRSFRIPPPERASWKESYEKEHREGELLRLSFFVF
ncbi:hypothetical protein VNO77_07839 [Canavalia gladiata]|uniref:Uncharacterized protein n=1 Tax=Canavalia gladiata TaxID=3824 RepID=A0AAN9MDM4_CANGL